jgi:nicotinate-nucleotide adenylyltransferase
MKIGVFGGTFNPIHVAHVGMARQYAEKLGLDKVILVPTYTPPHKSVKRLADAEDRLLMCRMATAGLPIFEVSDYEIREEGKSYTFKTLRHLKEEYPDSELYLIMGADMFITVQDWRQPEEIFRLATLCAAQRENDELTLLKAHKQLLETMGARCVIIDIEPTPLSSTMIRDSLIAGEDVSGLLHPNVLEYIRTQDLYRTDKKK